MSLRTLVCPYEPELINGFHEREIAVRVDSPSLVREAGNAVRNSGNRLLCVILDSAQPVDAVPFEDGWSGIPILLTAPAAGEFRSIVHKLPLLRSLNLKIYLSSTGRLLLGIGSLASQNSRRWSKSPVVLFAWSINMLCWMIRRWNCS